ncbi:MAG: pantetheine-phosphate adenylyltransferase [Firmicutes bacterium]|nr:pantetheine-phosphate adenylyltransferase [Bacillota bacterium]
MKVVVYPGSFDPMTKGHLDIIERGAKLADRLIVAVLVNANKMPMFTLEERIEILKAGTTHLKNVEIVPFTGLLVDFLKQNGARTVVKGLRAVSDFEYELQMAQANRDLYPEMETIFLCTNVQYSFISSTVVKDILRHGGDISHLVPQEAINIIEKILGGKDNGSGSTGRN